MTTRHSELLLKYFRNPAHAGALDINLPHIFSAKLKSADQSEVVELYLEINENKILKAKFKAAGSVAIIAGAEFLCEYVINKNMTEINQLTAECILKQLGLTTLKIHTAQLLILVLHKTLGASS